MHTEVQKGDRLNIPTNTYNAMVRGLNSGGIENNKKEKQPQSPVLIKVQNITGKFLPVFSIVQFTDASIKPGGSSGDDHFQTVLVVDADKPAADYHDQWGIIQKHAEDKEVVLAVCYGASTCRIDVQDKNDQYANPIIGESGHLKSAASGVAKILYKAKDSGISLAYVMFPIGLQKPFYIHSVATTAITSSPIPVPFTVEANQNDSSPFELQADGGIKLLVDDIDVEISYHGSVDFAGTDLAGDFSKVLAYVENDSAIEEGSRSKDGVTAGGDDKPAQPGNVSGQWVGKMKKDKIIYVMISSIVSSGVSNPTLVANAFSLNIKKI